ncbi:hypothetical protein E2C06_18320 [Dankookia rubra]|uniref:Uncharacterized protein n=1 Tax=Dankookia rubra TaxID=1442381 RepID=A0A4R5QDF5_9PROT|nr:hypothetical protein [Dankookia rubra]TDH61194.1 hypothetical protein E2C06_18320 [Dankookia rubra]
MVKSSMEQNERHDAAMGPVDSEGGRSLSALSTGQADPASGVVRIGSLPPGQCWSVGRKREVVLRLMRGESMELLSRELRGCKSFAWIRAAGFHSARCLSSLSTTTMR